MKILIVDDEPLARLRLRSLLEAQADPACEVAGEAGDAEAALAFLHTHAVQLVLLDVRMPGRDGLRLAARLRSLPVPPAVVFVTAHAEHALQAFELEAVDYLTKPVRRERLQAALQRVRQRIAPATAATADSVASVASVAPPVLVVSDRGRVLRVPLAEVLYLKAELKYVSLRTAAHTHLLDDTLAELEQRVGAAFLRVHRNALVARHALRELQQRAEDGDTWAVRVAAVDEWLAVSRRQLAAVREALADRAR